MQMGCPIMTLKNHDTQQGDWVNGMKYIHDAGSSHFQSAQFSIPVH